MRLPLSKRPRPWFEPLTCMLLAPASGAAWCGETGEELGLGVVPALPAAGQTFMIQFGALGCEVFFTESSLDRVVDVVGTTVRVTVEYIEGQVCLPEPIRTWSWSVGPLAEGSYTLVLVGAEPFDGGSTTELDQIPLTIASPRSQGARVVPTMQTWGMAVLALSLVATAAFGVRVRYP